MNDAPAIGWSGGVLQRCATCLTIVLFALLPFHAFLVTWLGFGLHVPGPLNAWKEIVIVILFGLTLLDWGMRKIRRRSVIASEAKQSRTEEKQTSFDILDAAILTFFTIGLLSSILQFLRLGNESFIHIFYGFKYDFLMLAAFFLFRHGPFTTPHLTAKAIKAILISGTIITVFAILQDTILPRDFLAFFGYTPAFGTWDPNGPLATYQALSADHPLVVRAAGTFAGPNQFAMYCLILLGLSISKVFPKHQESADKDDPLSAMSYQPLAKPKLASSLYLPTSILATLGIILSYSRSALAGLIAATISLPVFFSSKISESIRKWRTSLSIGVILGSIGIFSCLFLLPSSFLSSVFVRTNSSEGHWTRSMEGVRGTLEKPILGHGIGEAGPASTRTDPTGQGNIPENWYLQISLEYGLIGLIAWLTVLFLTAKSLYDRVKQPDFGLWTLDFGLLFSFVAINVACLFLHAWEDSAVALTWWGLAGLMLNSYKRS